MAVNSINEAMEIIKKLAPLTRAGLENKPISPGDLTALMAVGFPKVAEAVRYLDQNLPTGDPRRAGVTALKEVLEKANIR